MLQRNQCSSLGAVSVVAVMWRLATAVVLAVAVVPVAFAQADTEAPVLVSFDFTPGVSIYSEVGRK